MTFTEAAIEVLRREGKPLHFKKIAEIAIRDSLLDHIGKIPEEVMGGQLATHCRLPPPERKVMVVQQGTFALVEWGLDEDPKGLEDMIEVPPEDEVPYRGRERNPTPSREVARGTGRGEARGRRREEAEERRGRRYPPPTEVAYEILAGSDHAMALAEIAAQGAERFLMPDAFVRDSASLAAALAEDNRRRESGGRRPLFSIDGDKVSLAAQPEPGERVPLAPARAAAPSDARRSALLALRRRIHECDGATVEYVVARLLEASGLRELKIAKRGRDHVVYTGRRRMGLADVRHCIRVLRGGGDPGRRDVTDVRRDVGNYGAQIGVLVSSGEAGREARGESTAAGQVPVLLLCGDALAEALTEHSVGCKPIVIPEVDEAFFRSASDAAQIEEAARRARREDRDRRVREGKEAEVREPKPEASAPAASPGPPVREPAEARAGTEALPATAPPAPDEAGVSAAAAGADDEEGPEGEEEEAAESAEGVQPSAAVGTEGERAGEGRRRRRRRRRRGGRGRGREGEQGAAQAPQAGGVSTAAHDPAAGPPPSQAEAPPQEAPPPPAAAGSDKPPREPPPSSGGES